MLPYSLRNFFFSSGAPSALRRLKAAGVKLAVVSNFDTRLRPLLDGLGLAGVFDAVIVSAGACAACLG